MLGPFNILHLKSLICIKYSNRIVAEYLKKLTQGPPHLLEHHKSLRNKPLQSPQLILLNIFWKDCQKSEVFKTVSSTRELQ